MNAPNLNFGDLASNSMGTSTTPAFYVSGAVSVSQTMPAKPYAWVVGSVSVGAVLTVAPGTVVKASGGSVHVFGSLVAVGAFGLPVVFTSVNDNTVGGVTGNGTPTSGDWQGIIVASGGSVDIENAVIRYANIAVNVPAGTVSVRGSIDSTNAMGIRACNWQSGLCAVDAAYVDWGGVDGPFPTGRTTMVCVSVTVSPWLGAATPAARLFDSTNCDGTSLPSAQLVAAQQSYNSGISSLDNLCMIGDLNYCNLRDQALSCHAAQVQLALNHVSVAGIPASLPDTSTVVDGIGSWLGTALSPVVSGIDQVFAFANRLLSVVNLFSDLSHAYAACTPPV